MIEQKMLDFANTYPVGTPIDPQAAYNFLEGLAASVRTAVTNNPTTHINNINF